ncbi:MAG: hypothetical protein H0W50_01020 [Parachlamydiaceae bacterium]|nr:hypothetical protein [Parachlamydiaceae bacterium]
MSFYIDSGSANLYAPDFKALTLNSAEANSAFPTYPVEILSNINRELEELKAQRINTSLMNQPALNLKIKKLEYYLLGHHYQEQKNKSKVVNEKLFIANEDVKMLSEQLEVTTKTCEEAAYKINFLNSQLLHQSESYSATTNNHQTLSNAYLDLESKCKEIEHEKNIINLNLVVHEISNKNLINQLNSASNINSDLENSIIVIKENMNKTNAIITSNKRKQETLETEIISLNNEFKKRKIEFEQIAESDNLIVVECKKSNQEKDYVISELKNKIAYLENTTLNDYKINLDTIKSDCENSERKLKKTISELEQAVEFDNSIIAECKKSNQEKDEHICEFNNKIFHLENTVLMELQKKFDQVMREKEIQAIEHKKEIDEYELQAVDLKMTIDQQDIKISKLNDTVLNNITSIQHIQKMCMDLIKNSNEDSSQK